MSSKKNKERKNSNHIRINSEFKAKTINQSDYVRSIIENDVTFCTGPAGCGKTAVAVGLASTWLATGKINKIVITRPIVETGRKGLGFLPGSMQEKIHPYLIPILDEFEKYFDSFQIENFIRFGVIDIAPLEYMRGRNFHNCFMLLDEAQNATFDQLKMFITRIGTDSKCVINGDIRQSDLKEPVNSLDLCMTKLEDVNGVGICELTYEDILRSGIISKILAKLEN